MDPKGEKYSAQNTHHIVWARQILDSFVYDEKWSLVTDVGCGTGEVTRILAEKVPLARIQALDKFSSMVDQARQANPHPRIQYRVADIEQPLCHEDLIPGKGDVPGNGLITGNGLIPGNGGSDLVTSIHVLHWVQDIQTAMTNIKKLLKPNGGQFLLVHVLEMPYVESIKTVLQQKFPQLTQEWYDQLLFTRHWQKGAEEDYQKICQDLGLEVQTEIRRMDHYFDSKSLNRDLICVMYAALETLNGAIRDDAINAILEIFQSNCQDGKFHWYIDDLIVKGRRVD